MITETLKELKQLPTEPTKELIKKMFPRQNHVKLMARVNNVMAEIDRLWKKTDRIMSKKGFCLFLEETGTPPRYGCEFADGSTLAENLAEIHKMKPSKFFDQEGREITKWIKSGRTRIFVNKEEAEAYATRKRSYPYDLCAEIDGAKETYGWAVPD